MSIYSYSIVIHETNYHCVKLNEIKLHKLNWYSFVNILIVADSSGGNYMFSWGLRIIPHFFYSHIIVLYLAYFRNCWDFFWTL